MATSLEPGVFPAGGDDGGSPLGALEPGAGSVLEFVEVGRAAVGQGMPLGPGPEAFHRIEVRGQKRHLKVAACGVQILPHELAAMRLQGIPTPKPDASIQTAANRAAAHPPSAAPLLFENRHALKPTP